MGSFTFRGLAARLLLSRLRTARSVTHFAYRMFGPRVALIDRRGQWTYRQLQERVQRLHGWMHAQGVRKGEILFTWLPETGELYEARLAAHENGTLFASFHQHLPAQAALEMLARLEPAVFIYDPALAESILPTVRQRWPHMRLLALGQEYEATLTAHAPLAGTEALDEDEVFVLHMTSGTTGLPKCVGYTHRKYLGSIRLILKSLKMVRPDGTQDVNMMGLPLTGPGSGLVFPTLLRGGALVMPEHFHASELVTLIERHRVTRAYLSPSAIVDILDDPTLAQRNFSSLTQVPYGSEMMPAAKIAEAVERFGPIFQQGYGCFEALPPITWLLPEEHLGADGKPAAYDVLSSVGRVMPGVELVIRDEDFNPLPQGKVGYITVRTPVRFDGYWKDAERTRETLRGDWVIMGDMGYLDPQGLLHLLGRNADRVERHGQLINPREVEEMAHRHPAVKEACLVQNGAQTALVVSVRHGWQPIATCSDPAPRQRLEQDIDRLVQSLLPAAQHPDRVMVVSAIPRSFLNKMLRREVRALLQADAPPVWATQAPAPETEAAL